jgi:hypothetical protein
VPREKLLSSEKNVSNLPPEVLKKFVNALTKLTLTTEEALPELPSAQTFAK